MIRIAAGAAVGSKCLRPHADVRICLVDVFHVLLKVRSFCSLEDILMSFQRNFCWQMHDKHCSKHKTQVDVTGLMNGDSCCKQGNELSVTG